MTGTLEAPEWTVEDRALMLALQAYEATLCPGCGNPKQTAWHASMDGWWKTHRVLCHPCTEQTGEGDQRKEVTYSLTSIDPAVDDVDQMPELVLGVNTARPSETSPT